MSSRCGGLMRAGAVALAAALAALPVRAADDPPLRLVAKIPLGAVNGRIDHMAIDPARRRIFVAELGNDTVSVVDLERHIVLKWIDGLSEPQGIAYGAAADVLLVANGGDGTVRGFRGDDFSPLGRLATKGDADNIRIDPKTNLAWVGFGSGALAVFDPATLRKIGEIPLKAHPESFQIDPASPRIFVNVPDADSVVVADRASALQISEWKLSGARANFPMTLAGAAVIVVSRAPAKLIAFAADTGAVVSEAPTCGDADDVFADDRRRRLYVSCGLGAIDVFEMGAGAVKAIARIPTRSGARTSLFDPSTDRLFLAVRAQSGSSAELWEFQAQ